MFALLLSVHKHRMDCTTKKNTSLIAYVIFPSAAPFPAPSLAPFHTDLAGNFARKKSFCRCWYFGEPQHILEVNILPWSFFRTSFEWTWVRLQVLLGRLNGSTNLSGIFKEFHLDRKQVFLELFQFFSPHYYLILNQNSGSENIKGFAKELRKKKKRNPHWKPWLKHVCSDYICCIIDPLNLFPKIQKSDILIPLRHPELLQLWLMLPAVAHTSVFICSACFFDEEIDPANLYWWNIS